MTMRRQLEWLQCDELPSLNHHEQLLRSSRRVFLWLIQWADYHRWPFSWHYSLRYVLIYFSLLKGCLIVLLISEGVHLTLFIWCFHLLLRKKKSRSEYLLMIYVVLLFIMGNIGNGTNIKVGELTFVDNRNFPGGPNEYFSQGGGTVGLTCNVIYIINTWFQDGLLVKNLFVTLP